VISVKPIVGVGACLVGRPVRYNGESKRSNVHIDRLDEFVELRAFCPEMSAGLGVPRKPIRLVGDLGSLSLRDSDTQAIDYSQPVMALAESILAGEPMLAGYILVKGSPSCGYARVKRYNQDGNAVASDATGLFAAELMRLDPLLPVEEDGRLHDNQLRENFATRIYAYHDWKTLAAGDYSFHELQQFWVRYKYLVMAHHPASYRQIGRLLAGARRAPLPAVAAEFIQLLMQALNHLATRGSRTNVLQHIRGYLKRDLQTAEKGEVDELITQYREGHVPIVVPLTLMRHHFSKHRSDYIDQQVFMAPYPEQLGLRNHV
jgi:uncharacterized protein YbgA (DUF1722 family)/uncharacterized protein YbbK (DUF523 family)